MSQFFLSKKDLIGLASYGQRFQFLSGVYNLSAVDLAARMLVDFHNNATVGGWNVTTLVHTVTRNPNMTADAVEDLLSKFAELPADRQSGHAAIFAIMPIVSCIFLMIRFYTRSRLAGGMRQDDWWLLAAWLVATWLNYQEVYRVFRCNWEAHCWWLTYDQLMIHWILGTADTMEFTVAACFFKTGLCVFYRGLSPSRGFHIAGWALIGLVWTNMILCIASVLRGCLPIDFWNHLTTFKCIKYSKRYLMARMCINMLIDVMILLLPIIIVSRLSLKFKEKLMVVGLCGLGFFVCICSGMRIQALYAYFNSADSTWSNLNINTWMCLEPHMGIVCASAPMLRKYCLHIWPKLRGRALTPSGTKVLSSEEGASSGSSRTRPSVVHGMADLPAERGLWWYKRAGIDRTTVAASRFEPENETDNARPLESNQVTQSPKPGYNSATAKEMRIMDPSEHV